MNRKAFLAIHPNITELTARALMQVYDRYDWQVAAYRARATETTIANRVKQAITLQTSAGLDHDSNSVY